MVISNNKGEYLKQFHIENGDLFAISDPQVHITRITEREFATEFPATPIVFDILELLHDKFPSEEWKVEMDD